MPALSAHVLCSAGKSVHSPLLNSQKARQIAAPAPAAKATHNGLNTAPIAVVKTTPGSGKMMVAFENTEKYIER